MKFIIMILAVAVLSLIEPAPAVNSNNMSNRQKMEQAGRNTKRAVKNGVRAVKDETCEETSGQMECAFVRTKHGIEPTVDKIEHKKD